ncbi:hypothetical protein PO909_008184 [Leuciscus waleckii]
MCCLLLVCLYVGSMVVYRYTFFRDHPNTIKRRFTSVLCVSAVSPQVLLAWTHYIRVSPSPPLWALLGIRLEGFVPATLLPLTLTIVLFLGPLTQLAIESPRGLFHDVKTALSEYEYISSVRDLRWFRNQVVAPLTEKLVFRACMIPMLVKCIGPTAAIFISPLFFSVAFQFTYTSIFAFIFIRTGHLVGPVLCHSFCNCTHRGL